MKIYGFLHIEKQPFKNSKTNYKSIGTTLATLYHIRQNIQGGNFHG